MSPTPSPRTTTATHRHAVRFTLLASLTAVGVLLSACGGLGAADPAAQPSAASGLNPTCPAGQATSPIAAHPAPSHSVVAVLVQTNPAERNPAAQAARTSAIASVLAAAQDAHARLIADQIGATAASGQLAANLTLVGTGPNTLFRDTSLACATAAGRTALDQLAATHGPAGVDVLAGLNTLAEHLQGVPRKTTDVVLLGNLVGTTGPLNLTGGAALANPDATITNLANTGLLPDCRGWQVYAIGGGVGTNLDDEQQAALRELYRALFARCGGRLVVWDTNLVQFPDPGAQVPPLATPPPPPRKSAAGIVLTLPATEFATASATLLPTAGPALTRDLNIIARYPDAHLDVTGYSDSTPDPAPGGNQLLSAQRAAAVSAWLEAHGIAAARITSSGAGATHFIASNSSAQGRQTNRRVEIVIRSH